jgi:uncharacterized protein (TIGR03067 family)
MGMPRQPTEDDAMRRLLSLLVLLCLAFAPAPLPKREKPGKEALELYGVWENEKGRMVITATHLKFLSKSSFQYELRVNPSANPRTYDLIGVAGTASENARWQGIYKVEGDTLTRCYRQAKNGRPAGFEDKGVITAVHRRVR